MTNTLITNPFKKSAQNVFTVLVVLSLVVCVFPIISQDAFAFSNGQNASLVIGQSGFTTKTAPNPPTASSEHLPQRAAFDSSGNLWIADSSNSRVLEYTAPFTSGESASLIIGRSSFTDNSTAADPPTAASLHLPRGIAFDSSGNLWVVDGGNNRVLEYTAPFTSGESASLVIGQSGFTTKTAPNPPTAASEWAPEGITFDSSGNLWVADAANQRVLEYATPFTSGESASLVIGQSGFTTNTAPNPPTAASLHFPEGVAFDSSGNLWIGDAVNNRVLEYAKGSGFTSGESASLVLGQSGFTTNTAPNPPTAASEYLPQGITFDSSGNLWIADGGSNRILEYIKGSGFTNEESASMVIGQSSFATNATAISQSGLNIQSIAFNGPTFDSSGNLWMADELNNRVLEYVSISLAIGGHNVSIYHPPSLGNDYYYKYGSGFTLNGKSFDITKYGITIPQQVLKIGQSDNFTFKIYDERGGSTISHVGMYIHFKGDASVANSDTSFVWDKHDGVKISDPDKLFANANVTRHYDTNFAYISIKFTPTKAMPDSSIIMRMWDDKLASMDVPINGAIIIVDPNAPVQVTKVPDNQYGDYATLQNILDKDGYDVPSLLHKQYAMQQTYSSIDINWVYDKSNDQLTMVESDKSGNLMGEVVYSLFKKSEQPTVTDHDYVYIPTQLNRQDVNAEETVMRQEAQRAEKFVMQVTYVDSITPSFVPSGDAAPILGDYAYSKVLQLYGYDHQGEDNAIKAEAEKAVKLVESLGLVRQNNFENPTK